MSNSIKYSFRPNAVKLILQLVSILIFIGCGQNENVAKKKIDDKLNPGDSSEPVIEDLDLTKNVVLKDGIPVKYFIVSADQTYLYDSPTSTSITKEFLVSGTSVEGLYKSGEFVYIQSHSSEDKKIAGWVFAKDLEEVKFNPPRIADKYRN